MAFHQYSPLKESSFIESPEVGDDLTANRERERDARRIQVVVSFVVRCPEGGSSEC